MNAIILAAGMGTRLRPLTNDIPKCLVPIHGTPMVEQQIQFLQAVGINDITLVSGYKAEQLNYLIDKYGVRIVHNKKYDICNNIYSLFCVADRFGDSYIIEGDVYMNDNCFTTKLEQSTYFSRWKENYECEWGLIVNEQQQVIDIIPSNGTGYIMSGISYWTKRDAQIILDKLKEIMANEDYSQLFWDEILLRYHSLLSIRVKEIESIYEIDTVEEWQALVEWIANSQE